MHDTDARLTAWILGTVQGVGFRWWVYSQAKELALAGSASNLVDGRVCVVAEGPKHLCEELLRRLSAHDHSGRLGRVDTVVERWSSPKGEVGFRTR